MLQASYSRGNKKVEFYVASITAGFGRRGKLHQMPFNDTPFFEDLGRKGRVFTLEGYVMPAISSGGKLQPDNDPNASYQESRDLLIDIIENYSGTGTFVHPTMGSMRVVPTTECSFKFDNSVGRMETFSITFVEEGERLEDKASTRDNTISEIVKYEGPKLQAYLEGDGLSGNTKIEYENLIVPIEPSSEYISFPIPKQPFKPPLPDSYLKGLNKTMKGYLKKFDDFSKITKTNDAFSDFASEFVAIATTLQEFPQLIIGSVVETFNSIQKIITGFSIATQNPFDRLKNALDLFDSFWDDAETNTARYNSLKSNPDTAETREASSAVATDTLILAGSISQIGVASVTATYTSSAQVNDSLKDINRIFSLMIQRVGDSDITTGYENLLNLQAAINIDLNARAKQLPDIKIIFNGKVKPALVIAYNQYEDSERTDELVSKNNVSDPNFVQIGELEVIV
jgi:hypothetical protein